VTLALGLLAVAVAGAAGGLLLARSSSPPSLSRQPAAGEAIPLPPPRTDGPVSLEAAIASRRSVREYGPEPLSLEDVAQLLWAAQGITDPRGYRAAPSAGALYPLELYLVCGRVDGLEPGIYHYDPAAHALDMVARGDARDDLARAAIDQSPVRDAAIDLAFTAVYERTTGKYGDRGHRYVHMEAGHAAQNVYLQSTAMSLGAVSIGAFDDAAVQRLLRLPEGETPLYLVAIGQPT